MNYGGKTVREEDVDRKKPISIHKVVGLMFLIFAFIFLLTAAVLSGVDKEQIGARIVLIVIGACLLTAGATISWMGKNEGRAPRK